MSGFTVTGDFEGRQVTLWASAFSGLEIIRVDGREVSRKRSFRLSTRHDLSAAGLDADLAIVKLPCTLELHRKGQLVAQYKHPTAALALVLLSVAVAAVPAAVGFWLLGGR